MSTIHRISKKGGFVYLAECLDSDGAPNGWLKIGMSRDDPFGRVLSLRRENICCKAKIMDFTAVFDARAAEALLLAMVKSVSIKVDGEYFLPSISSSQILEEFWNLRDIQSKFIRYATGMK